eukprot:1141197-Pelagomonas_calceolata.AAC.3
MHAHTHTVFAPTSSVRLQLPVSCCDYGLAGTFVCPWPQCATASTPLLAASIQVLNSSNRGMPAALVGSSFTAAEADRHFVRHQVLRVLVGT